MRTTLITPAGVAGKFHVAAHEPSGYGVMALCGRSWDEGAYLVAKRLITDTAYICQGCRRVEKSRG